MDEEKINRVLEIVDEKRVVSLASKLVSMLSDTYEGQAKLAEYCAAYMEGLGMDVDLQHVKIDVDITSKQAIGRFRGTGEGPSLMFCSHLDNNPQYKPELWTKKMGEIDGGWLYSVNGQKLGMAAMITAADAVNRALMLKGDIIVACVTEEAKGGIGSQHMLEKGIKADMAVVAEDSDLEITTVSVAGIFGKITVKGMPEKPKGKIKSFNPFEKMLRVIEALKPVYEPAKSEGWLTFKPHLSLPGYPRFSIHSIESPVVYAKSQLATHYGDCAMIFDCRIVPGQSEETVKKDLEKLLAKLRSKYPDLKVELEIRPPRFYNRVPFEISREETIVKTVAKWHEYIIKRKPIISAGCRLGYASDANNLMAAGIKCVNYGPGNFGEPINEKKKIVDIVNAAKVYALIAADLCT